MDWERYGPVIIAILVLWVVASRFFRKSPTESSRRTHESEDAGEPRRTPRFTVDYDNLEVRLHDYSREIEARIDNRMMVLSQLTADADQAIRDLKPLLEELRAEIAKLPPPNRQDV